MEKETLGVVDYIVCAILVSVTLIIGIYYAVVSRKRGHVSEYLFAERSMSFLPLTLSLKASFESVILMIGVPAEGYGYGVSYVYLEVGDTLSKIFEQWLLLSFITKLNLESSFQYLELRFQSKALRKIITVLCCLENLMYISIVCYGQAIAIEAVTGFSMIGSIIVTVFGTLIYTSIGGLRAVIWTDVLQITFMFAGILLVMIKSTMDSGGFVEAIRRNTLTGRFDMDLSTDITVRHTLWNLIFGGVFYGFGFLFRPAVFQRMKAARTLLDSRRAILLAVLSFPFTTYLVLCQGFAAYSYFYSERCDPVASKQVDNFNQVIPFLILKLFIGQPGLPGIFVAGVFSATISTISSCLSALASMTFQDFVKPMFPNLSEFKGILVSKLSVVIYGSICCGTALWISTMNTITLIQIASTLLYGLRAPIAALFWIGLVFPFVNKKGAILALITAVCLYSWILIGSRLSTGVRQPQHLELASTDRCFTSTNSSLQNFKVSTAPTEQDVVSQTRSTLDTFYSISYTLYGLIGTFTVVIVGVTSSLVIGRGRVATDWKYVIPEVRNRRIWTTIRNVLSSDEHNDRTEHEESEMTPQTDGNERPTECADDNDLL